MNPERTPVFVVSLGAAAKETDDAAEDPNYRPAPQMGHVERLGAADRIDALESALREIAERAAGRLDPAVGRIAREALGAAAKETET
jgi:hypothetical protein